MTELLVKHPVYASLQEMLDPKSLTVLLGRPVTDVAFQPMEHTGLAGSQLSYIDTGSRQLVLKRMSIDSDFIMFSTSDTRCRAMRLWEYGLLDQLDPYLNHLTIACSRDGNGWAILMHDRSGQFFNWDKEFSRQEVLDLIDTLAKVHSEFWEDPRLGAEELGLMNYRDIFGVVPAALELSPNGHNLGVIPEWIRGGWEGLQELLDEETFRIIAQWVADPQPLIAALDRFPRTLVHGDYRAENLADGERPIVVDWQQAANALMTIDLAWLINHGYVRAQMDHATAITFYRDKLEGYLGRKFDDTAWQAMTALGLASNVLRTIQFFSFFYQNADNADGKRFNRMVLDHFSSMVQDVLQWL